MTDIALRIENLSVHFDSFKQGKRYAVADLSVPIIRGKTTVLLGESGCGKSMTAMSILGLLPPGAKVSPESSITYNDIDLLKASELQMRRIRGRKIAMIFQEPMTSLNPVLTIGQQVAEVLHQHFKTAKLAAKAKVEYLLQEVGIPDPARRMHEYPHQLSGGMKQRIMIAMALAAEPDVLVADEPTTALDVTIQAQVLSLLQDIQRKRGMTIILVTHDIGVVRQMADAVAVMYAGHVVEYALQNDFFTNPSHPYTKKLFAALPDLNKREQQLSAIPGVVKAISEDDLNVCRFRERCSEAFAPCDCKLPAKVDLGHDHFARCHLLVEGAATEVTDEAINYHAKPHHHHEPLLELDSLKIHFPVKKGLLKRTIATVKAVDGLSLTLHRGETLALVGESGCGKTTAGKGILQLLPILSGKVTYAGVDLASLSPAELRDYRRKIQFIFQDPFSSMNPRMLVGDIIAEGMLATGRFESRKQCDSEIKKYLDLVGISKQAIHRYPHEFSGGQRQRICIARALAVKPELIVCDEPTSALDVSVQAQILNLLKQLQQELDLTLLFITHNIAVVGYLADSVAVMYLGRVVEYGGVNDILQRAKHPYTQALLRAVPSIETNNLANLPKLGDDLPSVINPPKGCHYHTRCEFATNQCLKSYPPSHGELHQTACWLVDETSD